MAPITGKVRDPRRGTANHTANSAGGEYDYNPSGIDDTSWSAMTNTDGQTTTELIIYDDEKADGNKTLILSISDDANFGFSQETYILSENDDLNGTEGDNLYSGTEVPIPLSFDTSIKTATIIIEDNDSVFTPTNGNAGKNSLDGGNGNDIVYAKAGNDYVNGRKGNDNLYGEAGNDNSRGGSGNDYLNGGSGNDKLYGEADNDKLDGLTGSDSLYGAAGNDTLWGWDGKDYLDGGDGNDYLYGDAGNDTLVGGSGSDALIGGTGNNMLTGGAGDDFYSVDSTTDTITEYSNEGVDTVESSVSFTLGNNLENLELTGSSDISGTGNALDNTITGNEANNSLFGGDGDDTLIGDSKFSGGDGNDMLIGGSGNDNLVGGSGSDTLTGSAGADKFTIGYSTYYGIDTITDFSLSEGDKLLVSASDFGFGGLEIGDLPAEQFTYGSAAADASDRFIYDSSTGGVFFDPDGTGYIETTTAILSYGPRQIASLSPGLELTSSDISVIA